jgi:hypothetical protein
MVSQPLRGVARHQSTAHGFDRKIALQALILGLRYSFSMT